VANLDDGAWGTPAADELDVVGNHVGVTPAGVCMGNGDDGVVVEGTGVRAGAVGSADGRRPWAFPACPPRLT